MHSSEIVVDLLPWFNGSRGCREVMHGIGKNAVFAPGTPMVSRLQESRIANCYGPAAEHEAVVRLATIFVHVWCTQI